MAELTTLSNDDLASATGGGVVGKAFKWAFGKQVVRNGGKSKLLHPNGGTISSAPSRAKQLGGAAKSHAGKIGLGAAGAGAGWAARSGVEALTD